MFICLLNMESKNTGDYRGFDYFSIIWKFNFVKNSGCMAYTILDEQIFKFNYILIEFDRKVTKSGSYFFFSPSSVYTVSIF